MTSRWIRWLLVLSLGWRPRPAILLRQERKKDEAAGVPAAEEADRSIRRINNPPPTRPQRGSSLLGSPHGARRQGLGIGCLPEDPRTICPTDPFSFFFEKVRLFLWKDSQQSVSIADPGRSLFSRRLVIPLAGQLRRSASSFLPVMTRTVLWSLRLFLH